MISMQDSQSTDTYVKQQSVTFLNFLSAVARETGPEPIRRYELNEGFITQRQVESSEFVRVGADKESDAWLTISRPPHFPGIRLQEPLDKVIDPDSVADPLTQPKLSPDMVDRYVEQEMSKEPGFLEGQNANSGYQAAQSTKQRVRIRENINDAFSKWKDTQWKQWSEKNRNLAEAASLYNNFYNLFQQQLQETESKEIVWGQAIASRASSDPKAQVEYPLLLTTMSIDLESDGAISLTPSSSTQFDFSPLEGIGITGIDGLAQLQKHLSTEEVDIDIWNGDFLENLEQQIVMQLGSDAHISDTSSSDTSNATVDDSVVIINQWVVMLCRKKHEEEQFYKKLSDELVNNDFFPEALESIILDKDTLSQTSISSSEESDDSSPESERLLFPLPSNDEQERIARQIGRSAGVTVQGPPGTGKTHTIANLVCHLLAQGKRVLVTAEKAQALNVLQDKIPEPIRDLTMAFVGSTPDAMAKLKDSAQRMQDAVASVNPISEQSTVDRLQQELDQLQEQLAHLDRELDEALESEAREFMLPEGSRRATDVARWVSAHRAENIIPDGIGADEPFPLTRSEFSEFIQLCKSIDPQEAAEANVDATLARNLPDGPTVNGLFTKLKSAEQTLKQLQDAGIKIDAINSVSDRGIEQLQENINMGIEALASINVEMQERVFDSHSWDRTILNLLRRRTEDVLNNAKLGIEYDQKLAGYVIHVPLGNPSDLHALVTTWKRRIAGGHKLGFFTSKEIRTFAGEVTVNGQQPSTCEQLDLVDTEIDRQDLWEKTSHAFVKLVDDFNLSGSIPNKADSFIEIFTRTSAIQHTYTWCFKQRPAIEQQIHYFINIENPCANKASLQQCKTLLNRVFEQQEANAVHQQIQNLDQLCSRGIQQNPEAPIWMSFKQALMFRDAAAWNASYEKLNHLSEVRNARNRRNQLAQRLIQAGASSWTANLIQQRGNEQTYLSTDSVETSWEVAKAQTWLSTLHQGASVETISNQSARLSNRIHELTVELIRRQALMHLHKTAGDNERRALASWLESMRRVGKGTGKNAARYLAQAQAVLPEAMGAVPAWIMPIDQVLRSFQPGTTRPFDVVIVDESSQCDLMSVGVLALGKKAIIVGDDKQTSPSRPGQDTSIIIELQNRYLKGFPEKSLYTIDASLYSLADRAYGNTILLREHYRSVPEIINYSNRFYSGMIIPLRERTQPQIGNPLHSVFVENAISQKKGNYRVNRIEAHALVQQIVQCTKMPEYDGLTFGVVTFMQGDQKGIIEKELIDQLGYDEIGKRKLRVGNPPAFQGDERDVIFLSMVADDNSASYVYQWTTQWANVAVSRARDQIWVFYSMDPAKLNANDVRRGIIEYVSDYHEAKHPEKLYELTESQFERDVLGQILQHGYNVQPQYRVGNYRIDFVVTIAPGYRLAIECDGDAFHGLDKQRDDIRRQRTLERCGWNFWRIRGSVYYLDPGAAMEPLWHRLEEMRKQAEQDTSLIQA